MQRSLQHMSVFLRLEMAFILIYGVPQLQHEKLTPWGNYLIFYKPNTAQEIANETDARYDEVDAILQAQSRATSCLSPCTPPGCWPKPAKHLGRETQWKRKKFSEEEEYLLYPHKPPEEATLWTKQTMASRSFRSKQSRDIS